MRCESWQGVATLEPRVYDTLDDKYIIKSAIIFGNYIS